MKPHSFHVIHVITTLEYGGAEKQLLILAAEQVRSGKKVSVIFLKANPSLVHLFQQKGITVIGELHGMNFFKQIWNFRKLLKTLPVDLIHAHLPRAEILSAIATVGLREFGVTRHNAEGFWPDAPWLLSSLLSRIVTRRSIFVIAISQAVKDFLIKNKEVPKSVSINVVLYGFDREAKRELKNFHKTSQLQAVMIARLVKQKNHEGLFRALSLMPRKIRPSVTLVGKGHLELELRNQALNLDIADSLTWIPMLTNVRETLKSFDLMILPSLYEGFGLVILEAMCAGVPIVASNCAALIEVLGSDYPGLFQLGDDKKLSDKLEEFNDPGTRMSVLRHLEERLRFFDPQKMNERVEEIYFSTSNQIIK